MSWFQRLTGFVEANYDDTRHKLEINGRRLRSLVNGKSYGWGSWSSSRCSRYAIGLALRPFRTPVESH